MPEVEWSAFFTSDTKTILYIFTPGGVQRGCFNYGQKRVGGNIILGCEPPVPWTKTFGEYKVGKELTEFL